MKQKSFSDYIIYVDESGVPSFGHDKDFPVFVLAFCIFDKDQYSKNAVRKLKEVKFKYFGHDMVILHENDIRRDKGCFKKFKNKEIKKEFFADLTQIISEEDFTIIATVIKKDCFPSQNVSPYHIALKYCMEGLYHFLEERNEHDKITHIVIERRGKKEDSELELEFRRICDGYNYQNIIMNFDIIMSSKLCNSAGLQLADLVARPLGVKILNPQKENRAFEVIKTKIYKKGNEKIEDRGLKVFPKKLLKE